MNESCNFEINVKDLTHYYNEKLVLDHCSFKVKKGQSIGILGESGCGKSTLLKYLAGLYEINGSENSGSIMISGESNGAQIRKKVAMVMQDALLLPGTIRENITCGRECDASLIEHVCEAAGLKEWISSLPSEIDTYLGDRANELSGGQAQRISIARAMVKDAPVILLDEATSALDMATGEAIMEALKKLTLEKTVVHVTHHPEILSGYDYIYHMEGGRLYG